MCITIDRKRVTQRHSLGSVAVEEAFADRDTDRRPRDEIIGGLHSVVDLIPQDQAPEGETEEVLSVDFDDPPGGWTIVLSRLRIGTAGIFEQIGAAVTVGISVIAGEFGIGEFGGSEMAFTPGIVGESGGKEVVGRPGGDAAKSSCNDGVHERFER